MHRQWIAKRKKSKPAWPTVGVKSGRWTGAGIYVSPCLSLPLLQKTSFPTWRLNLEDQVFNCQEHLLSPGFRRCAQYLGQGTGRKKEGGFLSLGGRSPALALRWDSISSAQMTSFCAVMISESTPLHLLQRGLIMQQSTVLEIIFRTRGKYFKIN